MLGSAVFAVVIVFVSVHTDVTEEPIIESVIVFETSVSLNVGVGGTCIADGVGCWVSNEGNGAGNVDCVAICGTWDDG